MRFRGLTVLTNTPPRGAQSAPGGMQGITIMETALVQAAHKLGIDQVELRRINAPEGKALFGPPAANGKLPHATSSFVKEALDKGAEQFRWKERAALPKRSGNMARGVSVSAYSGGSIASTGCSGQVRWEPYIQLDREFRHGIGA
jgi:CO/xanthine dehydrogenase Mo-binding subunit